ncbi:MAG TPA: ABC transporter permease [Vicinamibacterales bacterium]|nr:ABC transporter permease [Vicinamibacterales bacterium]
MPEWPDDVAEELRQHLDDQYRELRAAGASHDDALRAMADDVNAVRSRRSGLRPELVAADVRYAFRTLRRNPGFAIVVLLTLALGIGANAAIFSVVNGVLLRPLPYRDADRLMVIRGDLKRPGLNDIPASAGEYVDYRDRSHAFEQVAAYDTVGFNLTGGGEPERVDGAIVSTTLFSLLGASAQVGRTLVADEDQPGRDDVVVLSHSLWTRRFSANPAIVGQTIPVDGRPAQVVGVMPAAFQFPDRSIEIWKPFLLDADALSDNNRGSHGYTALARLKAGISRQQAQADLNAVTAAFKADHPGNYRNGFGATLRPLQEEIVGDTGRPLIVLLGAVAIVLLIACANVANLLLARAASRRKEIALRTALGASRGRLVRQLMTESVLVSAIGGLIGLGLAAWGVDLLIASAPDSIPRIQEVGVDARVAGFTALVSLATGLVFGLVPALRASRAPLNDALKEGGRAGGGVHGFAGRALVVSEVALSLVLLIAAGLLIHSFTRLQDVAPGFDSSRLLTFRLSLPESRYTTFQKGQSFFDEFFAGLRRSPGVRGVAAINALPFSGLGGSRSFHIEGREEKRPEDQTEEQLRIVTDGYFAAMGIPIVAGREFTDRDALNQPRVAVVNDAMAKKHWPHESPIGKRVSFSTDEPHWYEIVGVAGNIKHRALEAADRPELYVPYRQPLFAGWTVRPMYVIARTSADPASTVAIARHEIARVDRDQPISDVRTMDERIGRSLSSRRFSMVLLALFAGLALTLAAVGIYGVVAYAVTERTHEIGVRVALGAQRRDVMAMVVGQGMTMTLVGTAIGVAASAALARLMSSLLFGVSAVDPVTFVLIPMLLIAVALAACYVPARRAMRVDPLQALRSE